MGSRSRSFSPVVRPVRPTRIRLRATFAFAVLAMIAGLSLAVAWVGAGTLALVFAAGASLALLSPLLARAEVARVRLAAPAEATFVAGRSQPLDVTIENAGAFSSRDLLLVIGDGRRGGPTGHVARLRPGERRLVPALARFTDRGRAAAVTVHVESSFPFGLFLAHATFELEIDLVVLPRVGRLGVLARRLRPRQHAQRLAPSGRLGDGEFHALREWRAGESLRGVAWRPSARRGRLLARELVNEDEPPLHLVLGCWIDVPARAGRRYPPFERAVSLAATIVEHVLGRGRRLLLELAGPEPLLLGPHVGRGDLVRMLTALAEVEAVAGDPALALRACTGSGPGWTTCLVVAGRGEVADTPEVVVLDVEADSGLEAFEGMTVAPGRAGAGRAEAVPS